MRYLSKPSARTLAVFLTGTLLNLTPFVRADEPEPPAPSAPPNAPEASVAPAGQPAAVAVAPPITPSSSAIVEPTFTTETHHSVWPNKPLLATGATVFGLAYLPAVAGAAFSDADGRKHLYIPVAGPFLMYTRGEEETGGAKALLLIDGIAQSVGALMLLSSLFVPERATKHWYLIGANRNTMLAPTRIASGVGLAASGRF
jgi:hypothetical protein